MYNSIIDKDKAGECVRNILDNIRCGICDKLGSIFRRCVHGHIICDDCIVEESCPTCSNTFNSPVLNTWITDELHSQKVKHALDLLNTFQDTFKTDVYRRQRISEQLKVEKELFPDCIQAPIKYSNKRKTLKSYSSIFDKENSKHSYLPGEETSPLQTSKMEKSKYIQHWLESSSAKSSPRKPFANINVNNQRVSDVNLSVLEKKPIRKYHVKNTSLNKKQPLRKSIGKKGSIFSHLKKSSVNGLSKTPKKDVKTENLITNNVNNLQFDKTNKFNDDSGIAMDEECITIDDSQSEKVDKDALALQAVYEAEKHVLLDDHSTYDDMDTHYESYDHGIFKVKFVKKSLLYKSCPNCNIDTRNSESARVPCKNEINITVEYGSKVESNLVKSVSVQVQTEISGFNRISNQVTSKEKVLFSSKSIIGDNVNIKSQDLFIEDINTVNTPIQNDEKTITQNKENVIIDDSDTDVEAEFLQVAAQVHRSCNQKDYDILSELAANELKNRKRRAVRGVTPGSTDSSDKENLDPNRMKRSKCTKKGKKKPNKG